MSVGSDCDSDSGDVGVREIVADEQQRLARRPRQRVGETVAEIQPGTMPGSLPEVLVGGAGDADVLGRHRHRFDTCQRDEIVEAATEDRVAIGIHDDGDLQERPRGDATGSRRRQRREQLGCFGLVSEDGDEGRAVDYRTGRP